MGADMLSLKKRRGNNNELDPQRFPAITSLLVPDREPSVLCSQSDTRTHVFRSSFSNWDIFAISGRLFPVLPPTA